MHWRETLATSITGNCRLPPTQGKVLWLGGSVSAAYAFGHYAKRRLLELQEQSLRDRIAHDNLQRRFDQNQQDCTFHVLSLLPDLADSLFDLLNAELLAQSLQLRRSPPPPVENDVDAELWHEIKIVTLTRLLTALYSLSMVATLTRVQLNLVGRRRYLDSDIAMMAASPAPPSAPAATMPPLCQRVRVAVESVFGGIPLKKSLSQADLASLLIAVRQRIEAADFSDPATGPFHFQSMLFPSESDELATLTAGGLSPQLAAAHLADPTLRSLLNETRDVLDSPHARVALLAGFANVFDTCVEHHWAKLAYPQLAEVSDAAADATSSHGGVPLAALLPHAKQLAHVVLNGVPNEYVAVLARTAQLNQLAMVVYAQFAGACVE
ncbi:Peroxin-3 [Catenaria anguillulae PL171]|uniref:Peroxin-3 n=1 Tax=Catenaria anguillulae PL171 TaxID=765915 RepID=A0A1Y2HBD4_9FUNG|nr:Peroxin-3 [Catenaria anguillulae PL171]